MSVVKKSNTIYVFVKKMIIITWNRGEFLIFASEYLTNYLNTYETIN